jgi:hypothetical protein
MNKEIFLEPNFVMRNMKYFPLLGMVILPIAIWFLGGLPNDKGWTYLGSAQQAIAIVIILELIVYLFLDRLSKMQTHYFIHEGTVTHSYGQQYKMKELHKFPLKGLVMNKEFISDYDAPRNVFWLSNEEDLHLSISPEHKDVLIDFFGMESEGQEDASENKWTIPTEKI